MKQATQNRFVSPADLCLIAVLLVICLAFFAWRSLGRSEARMVIIEKDGAVLYTQVLRPSMEPQSYVLDALEVAITSEGATVIRSDCPDQICVRTGALHHAGDTAVCLPNRVVVRLTGGTTQTADGITG